MHENGRQRGPKYLNFILALLFLSLFVFWRASGYGEAIRSLLLAWAALCLAFILINRRDDILGVKECKNRLACKEYRRRLDKAAGDEVLRVLQDSITTGYPAVEGLALKGDMLTGSYEKRRLGVVYRYVDEEDTVETRDLLYLLHDCREQGIKEARVFTNGEFSRKAVQLGERYGINLKLYNGSAMKHFLKGTSLYPTESEIDAALKRESEKRQRRIDVLKKELLQKNKFKNYLIYGLVLLLMSRLGIGIYYWNVLFAALLLIMAVSSLVVRREQKEEENVF